MNIPIESLKAMVHGEYVPQLIGTAATEFENLVNYVNSLEAKLLGITEIGWRKDCECESLSTMPGWDKKYKLIGKAYSIFIEEISPPTCCKCGKKWVTLIKKDDL